PSLSVFLSLLPPPPTSPLFPYTTLFRSDLELSLSPPTVDETFAIKSRLIRQGSLDNLWLRTTFRLTFPPFHIEIISVDVECRGRSEEHTSELQSLRHLVCRLLLEKKKKT